MAPGPYLQRLRERVGRDRLLVPSAALFLRDPSGRVLLQRRSDNGEWNLPGGAMELNESLADTAVREIAEETGLVIQLVRLVGIYSGPMYHYEYPNGDKIQAVLALFEGRAVSGSLRTNTESADLRYFGMNELPPLPSRQHVMLQDALAGRAEAFFR